MDIFAGVPGYALPQPLPAAWKIGKRPDGVHFIAIFDPSGVHYLHLPDDEALGALIGDLQRHKIGLIVPDSPAQLFKKENGNG